MEIKNSMFAKLDPYRTRLDPNAEAAAAQARAPKGETAGTPAAAGDRVSVSSAARLHTLAHAEAGKAPDVRQEKVDSIKERVASGEYRPDSRKIAERMLQSDALLAGTLEE